MSKLWTLTTGNGAMMMVRFRGKSGTETSVYCHSYLGHEMRDFDNLPRKIRDFINEHGLVMPIAEIYDMLEEKHPEEFIINALKFYLEFRQNTS